jgi:peptidoglycan/LPS O-acetylase OafA/YrhL
MAHSTREDRLVPLHGLRGLSALAVAVFFHYAHFGGITPEYPLANHAAFRWVYEHGALLVDLFFLLSGIIFTHRYLAPLAEGKVSGREFFLLRFSRLYPLHLAMLVLCASVQWTLLWFDRGPVVYENVDLYSFVLQAAYLHMAFYTGWAFNAPTWSVSAEILAYWSFFLFASRYRKNYVTACIVTFLVALYIETTAGQTTGGLLMINGALARGLVGFYLGSLGYLAMRQVEKLGHAALLGRVALGVFALEIVLAHRFGYEAWIGTSAAANCLAVFPPLVFASLCVRPLGRLLSIRPLVFLGDISYSIYLVHVPVQTILIAVMSTKSFTIPLGRPVFLACYAGLVVGVAALACYTIEKPASRWLRQRYLRPAPGAAAEAPGPATAIPAVAPEPAALSIVRE